MDQVKTEPRPHQVGEPTNSTLWGLTQEASFRLELESRGSQEKRHTGLSACSADFSRLSHQGHAGTGLRLCLYPLTLNLLQSPPTLSIQNCAPLYVSNTPAQGLLKLPGDRIPGLLCPPAFPAFQTALCIRDWHSGGLWCVSPLLSAE